MSVGSGEHILSLLLPYLLVYKSNLCISRPPIFKFKNRIFIISSQRSKIQIDRNSQKLISYFWERIENTENWKTAVQNVMVFFEVYQHLFISPRFKYTQALRFIGKVFYHIL